MSKVKPERAISISRWPSSRMKMMLTERWPEVWAVVETRVHNPREFNRQHPQKNQSVGASK